MVTGETGRARHQEGQTNPKEGKHRETKEIESETGGYNFQIKQNIRKPQTQTMIAIQTTAERRTGFIGGDWTTLDKKRQQDGDGSFLEQSFNFPCERTAS